MRSTKPSAVIAAAVFGVLALAACTPNDQPTQVEAGVIDAAARDYVLSSLEQRTSAADGVWVEDSLEDLLPSHEFAIDGGTPAPLAEGIVVGTVTSVDQGRGYMIEGDDAADGTEIPFADSRALWRVIVLTVKTDTRLGDVDKKTIKVGVVIDGGMDVVKSRDGYLSLGRVALVLNAPGKFGFDPAMYSIRQSGALLGLVSASGKLRFPGLGTESADFVDGLDSIDEVVTEAVAPAEVVDVDQTEGEFIRDDE